MEVAVEKKTEQITGIERRTPCGGGMCLSKAKLVQIERGDKSIEKANGVLRADVIVDGFQEE